MEMTMKFLPGFLPVVAVIFGVVFISVDGLPGTGVDTVAGSRGQATAESSAGQGGAGTDQSPADDSVQDVYGGTPKSTMNASSFEYLDNIGFDVGYSESRQDPVWVGYRVDARRLPGKLPRPDRFEADSRTTARVGHRDYSRSGYDRGHMAPNHAIATRYGRDAQNQTFLMSNIVPQKPALNRQVWRRLEELEAESWAGKFGGVWVITGPIFDDDHRFLKRNEPRIEIPDAFFKIVIDEREGGGVTGPNPRVMAFIIPQDVSGDESLSEFLVSVDWVEQQSGLDLMSDLPDDVENAVESGVADGLW